ncbi:acyl-CoA dehydrogenase [Variovorax sp. M-6]|uniref:acyl-CoA dehydrogenase n=1 Tax=Variovorax sp. M-6 TaxID=3233041 RepID=UPI003F99421A
MQPFSSYKAPLPELRFILNDLLHIDDGLEELGLARGFDREAIDALMRDLARFAEEVLAPLNRIGDRVGCVWRGDEVSTPPGYKSAYDMFRHRGWAGLGAAVEHGGQALPTVLTNLVTELFGSANHSWLMYHSISRGGYECIRANGTPAQQAMYLPRLASGEWTSSMCITEREAGTDVGLLRTEAVPQPDGSYRLTGLKRMVTAAEHDLADNIVHLVLARIEGAPPGARGLSLFIVPKHLPGTTTRNAVRCDGIEDKMGIRGTPTCWVQLDGARGELLNTAGNGLAAMFVMMNIARLATGMQGLNQAEAAYQLALGYARTRLQGRKAGEGSAPSSPADPLIVHADVRRMLLTQKAWTEGTRALAYWLALQVDRSKAHPRPQVRQEADDLVSLLTPVLKAFATDNGYASTTLAQQVMGGWGYLDASGVHQYIRDVRVGQIYEGANGIQGQDLLGRKILGDRGSRLRKFQDMVRGTLEKNDMHPVLRPWISQTRTLCSRLDALTQRLLNRAESHPDQIGASGHSYLRVLGVLALAWQWIEIASIAQRKIEAGQSGAFESAKMVTARFYFAHLFPEVEHHLLVADQGCDTVMALDADLF